MEHKISNRHLTITVSERGAELQSILGADGTEYLWQGDPRYWADRALNIFPYVARLTQGQYELDGQRYAMRIHGIAMYEPFILKTQTARQLLFSLTDTEETFASYPRHFSFLVTYTLHGPTLSITYQVENRDSKPMYFGLGGHPGFRVPFAAGSNFEDYFLRFQTPCQPLRVGFTEACFVDGTYTPFLLEHGQDLRLCHSMFDQDAIVLKNTSREVTLRTEEAPCVTVKFPDFPYLGIWHAPKTDAPYICIEPWSSLPSTQDQIAVLEKQEDLLSLEPGQRYETTWQIIIGKDANNETF